MGYWDGSGTAGPYANNLHLVKTDNHTTPHHSIVTGRMLFLMPNQQRQSTVRHHVWINNNNNDRLTAFDPGQPG